MSKKASKFETSQEAKKNGWFSRRYQTAEEHQAATQAYQKKRRRAVPRAIGNISIGSRR